MTIEQAICKYLQEAENSIIIKPICDFEFLNEFESYIDNPGENFRAAMVALVDHAFWKHLSTKKTYEEMINNPILRKAAISYLANFVQPDFVVVGGK